MSGDTKNSYDQEQKMLYDLRQRRAKIIGDCMDDVIAASKVENYYIWFKNIEDLYDVSEHAFIDKDKTAEKYKELKGKVMTKANAYPSSWSNANKVPKESFEIETALRNLFRYLMRQIEESGIFGKGQIYDEDEV